MSGISLNLVVLRSTDIEAAAEFYRCLGLEFVRQRHGDGPEHFAAETMGGVFEIYPLMLDGPRTSGTRVGFSVSSLDESLAALQPYPRAIVSPPKNSPWGYRAVVKDPDGHRVELVQR
jgi:lactoylglutathione lyase